MISSTLLFVRVLIEIICEIFWFNIDSEEFKDLLRISTLLFVQVLIVICEIFRSNIDSEEFKQLFTPF